MIQNRRTNLAGARHEIHHARRQAGVLENLREFQRGDRGRFGGLEDDGVTHGERGREFPRAHEQREIPRDHLPNDAQRRDAATRGDILEFIGPARVIKEMRSSHGHVEVAGFLDRFTAVERLGDGEFPRAILQEARDAIEILGAFAAGHFSPNAVGRALGGSVGRIDISGAGERDFGEFPLVGRINGIEIFAALRRDEFSVDEKIVARLQLRIGRFGRRIEGPEIAENEFGRTAAGSVGDALGSAG